MSKLQPIQLEDGSILYVEATDNIQTIDTPANGSGNSNGYSAESSEEASRTSKGWNRSNPNQQMAQSFQAIENTIKTYTQHTLNAFRDAAMADVKKVTLEFGVNVSGVGGVPYIATGTAGCNIKVVVECAFPERAVPGLPAQAAHSPQTAREMPPSSRMAIPRELNGMRPAAPPPRSL
jgi:hypothetical protein